MRTITDHKLNGLNDALEITVLDVPGQGGASHRYQISGYSRKQEVVANSETGETEIINDVATDINFQNGSILEAGVNGISGEALLAIVIDRLRCFQAGPYASNENMHAMVHATQCLEWLQKRTKNRLARGVEGTNQM